MFSLNDRDFEKLVHDSVDGLPTIHKDNLKNVGFFILDWPTDQQRIKSNLQPNQMLLGLYEGVPLSQRNGAMKLLPDTITLFKIPIEKSVNSMDQLKSRIKNTVWHEVAHYYGLDHDKIHEIERRNS